MAKSRNRLPWWVASLVIMASVLSGCSPHIFPTEPYPTAPRSGPNTDLADPVEILALAGRTLPEGVNNDAASSKADELPWHYYYAYTVSWEGTIDTTNAFLAQNGEDISWGMTVSETALDATLYEMDVDSVPVGSRVTEWRFAAHLGNGTVMVLMEGPDLTTVHVSISALPN